MDFPEHEDEKRQPKCNQYGSYNFHLLFLSKIHPELYSDKMEDTVVLFLLHLVQVEKKTCSISKTRKIIVIQWQVKNYK